MAACTWRSNSNLSQTLKKAKYLKVTQLLSRQSVPTTFYGCIVSKLPTQAWNKAKISRTTYPSENGSFQARKSLYNWRILIGRIAWRTPPDTDTALDILTELFPWRSASELMYFARLRHGIFPCLSENSKVGLISGMCLVQLAHLGSVKESRRFYVCFISEWNKSCQNRGRNSTVSKT